jgi:hypothetical protein
MSTAPRAQRAKSGSDGFIIVAVLWILAALATLVSVYAIYVTNSAIAVAAGSDAVIADPLVAAGVELTSAPPSASSRRASARRNWRSPFRAKRRGSISTRRRRSFWSDF